MRRKISIVDWLTRCPSAIGGNVKFGIYLEYFLLAILIFDDYLRIMVLKVIL